jgi:hypothetical protein
MTAILLIRSFAHENILSSSNPSTAQTMNIQSHLLDLITAGIIRAGAPVRVRVHALSDAHRPGGTAKIATKTPTMVASAEILVQMVSI